MYMPNKPPLSLSVDFRVRRHEFAPCPPTSVTLACACRIARTACCLDSGPVLIAKARENMTGKGQSLISNTVNVAGGRM